MTDTTDEELFDSNRTPIAEQSPSVGHGTSNAIGSSVTNLPHVAALANGSGEVEGPPRSRRLSSVSIIHSIVTTSHLLTTIEARRR